MSPPRVIVIGAGPAGLAAARRLTGAGADVCVLERGEHLGGRAWGEVREGFVWEPAGAALSTGQRGLGRLLNEAGLADALLPMRAGGEGQLRGGWIHETRGEGWRAVQRLPGVSAWAALRTRRLGRLQRRFRGNVDPLAPEHATPHDDRSLADFARLYFGPAVLERWAGPLVTGDCLGDEDDTSRALFLLREAAAAGATQALFRRGSGAFWEALAQEIEVRHGAEAVSVEPAGSGAVVRFREQGAEGTVGADAVVVATPGPVAESLTRPLLSPAERHFFADVDHWPAITLVAALGDPIGPRFLRLRVPRQEGWAAASLSLEPGSPGGRVPDGHALARVVARSDWSRAHYDAPDDVVQKELWGLFARVFPEAGEKLRFANVYRWERALPRFEVGRYRALERFARVQRDRAASGRRVHFAGDYLADPSIDGAVTSGLRAADAVLQDLG